MKRVFLSMRTSFALLVLLVATLLCVLNFIDGDAWVSLAKTLASAVMVGHTISHAVEVGRAPSSDLPAARTVPPA